MKPIAYILGVAILSGCASTPVAQLPENLYTDFAGTLAGMYRCAVNGDLHPEEAALGLQQTRARLDTWSYDAARMKHTVDILTATATPSKEWCVTAAIVIASNKNQAVDTHGAIAVEQKTLGEMITRPRYTFCNQLGTQTICSSN